MSKPNMNQQDLALERTRAAFIWTRILNTPFWAIFSMLPFILYKDLKASALQITLIIVLKPLVSIFSTYWSAVIDKRRDRLLSNVISANILKHIPFLFFPFTDNVWFIIFASGVYMMLHRGAVPAWMEIMKLNIAGEKRERIFAYGTAVGYLGDGVLPFILGPLLDGYVESWRYIFPILALVSFMGVYFQARIPIKYGFVRAEKTSLRQQLYYPWKNAYELLLKRPDFLKFQLGFMLLGGGGLMVMQPALPGFFMDVLHLSYTELAIALTLCKGVGCALASSTWAKMMNRVDIYRFSSWVTLMGCLFPLCLLASQVHSVWLYLAYTGYGVMQAGSELSWNMSGPIFAKDEDSSAFSSVNVLMVGLRGAVVPTVGSVLCFSSSPAIVILFGGGLCLAATLKLIVASKQKANVALALVQK